MGRLPRPAPPYRGARPLLVLYAATMGLAQPDMCTMAWHSLMWTTMGLNYFQLLTPSSLQ